MALDAATGRTLWTWRCEMLTTLSGETGVINRGVALLDDKVFYAAPDARLFAIDAATGKQAWVATVEPDFKTYYITGAPLAFRDIVVTGTSTRQVGRGVLAAFDAKTGAERWRFHVIPEPGEPGNETWAGDSWRNGGGPPWLSGSYDPDEDLMYWGVGNPKPDYDTAGREGDNLYTNSVVALHGSTGKLAWHFQFVPADNKDWGANQIPVLVDRARDGGLEKQLLWANRNGFYYNFDRVSGKFLRATPFVHQTWTPGIDENGRPLPLETKGGDEGQVLYPGNVGGTHWSSPTYDPERDLMIVPVLEQGMVYFNSFRSPPKASGRSFYTAVRALAAQTGELVWEYRRPPRFVDNFMPGLVSTAGGVVFGSDQSTFFALDAESGKPLWSVETGGNIIAAPMTFAVDGRQFVSIAAGGDLLTFALPEQENLASGAANTAE
jgi:alcohol dehydrogenase (cytochrome c)